RQIPSLLSSSAQHPPGPALHRLSLHDALPILFHEGIQIPPVKLYCAGELQQDILNLVARNSRTPEMTVGDMLALSAAGRIAEMRSEEHTSELQSRFDLVCRLLLEKKNHNTTTG